MGLIAVLGDQCIGSGSGYISGVTQTSFLITGKPVALVGDTVFWIGIFPLIGPFTGSIISGYPGFLVNGKPVAGQNSAWVAGPYSGTINVIQTTIFNGISIPG
jgi:uncharacterized Zn-binding protein involved in type VI secretion